MPEVAAFMRNLSIVFFLLSSTICLAQPWRREKIDSLKRVFALAVTDTAKAKLLRPICYNLRQLSPDSALVFLQEVSALAENKGFKTVKTTALYLTGFHYAAIKADPRTAFQYYINAYKLAEESGDHLNMGSGLAGMASIYSMQGQNHKALESYKKAAENYAAAKADRQSAIAHSAIAETYVALKNYDHALLSIKIGIEITERLKDEETKARLLMVMSTALQGKGNFEQAILFSKRATDIYCNLGNNQYCAFCLTLQADQARELGHAHDALNLACEALSVCEKYGLEIEKMSTYEVLDKIHFKLQNFEMAYYYKEKFIQMRDSALNQSKSADIANIEAKFVQDKKDAIAGAELERQQMIRNGFVLGFGVMILFAIVFFVQRNKISKGKKHSDQLLLNILPAETAEELKTTGAAQAKYHDSVTVMFTDFKDFTQASEQMSAEALVKEIHFYFCEFDQIISKYGIEKIKTIGDSYMCAAGLNGPGVASAIDALATALEIRDFMLREKEKRLADGKAFLEIRIGLHTGPVVSGVVGIKKFAYDIWGDTVNVAARIESSSEANRVNISGATYEQVKGDFYCVYRGKIAAKHKGAIDMYFVEHRMQ